LRSSLNCWVIAGIVACPTLHNSTALKRPPGLAFVRLKSA
jgi:hypothetical protein